MFDEEMITKYRYIILLLGTAVSFVLGFVVAFALAKLCGVMGCKGSAQYRFHGRRYHRNAWICVHLSG